jgi:4-hydroxy-tetrahydrodipicolinate synthase
MMYNVPGRTGVDLKPATVYEASLHPLITSLKEATGDISRVTVLREMCGKNFGLYSGDDETGCKWTLLVR